MHLQNDLTHLYVKKILYTYSKYPWGINFGRFCSRTNHFRDTRLKKMQRMTSEWHTMTSHFQDARLLKIGKLRNVPNDRRLNWNILQSKVTIYIKYTKGRHLAPFRSTRHCRDIRLLKIGKINCTRNNQEYPVTLGMYLWGPNFGSFCSTNNHFQDTRLSKLGNDLRMTVCQNYPMKSKW